MLVVFDSPAESGESSHLLSCADGAVEEGEDISLGEALNKLVDQSDFSADDDAAGIDNVLILFDPDNHA